jgi:hypothetical protein
MDPFILSRHAFEVYCSDYGQARNANSRRRHRRRHQKKKQQQQQGDRIPNVFLTISCAKHQQQ